MKKLILASGSPRRKELLALIGLEFEVIASDADESISCTLHPQEFVRTLAIRKAEAIAADHPHQVVLGADTIVEIDGMILGKPKERAQAEQMLRLLSGRIHRVYTGVALLHEGKQESFTCCTKVKFIDIDDELLEQYLDSGEAMDKAGAYGIQGRGAVLVEHLEGDYFNVMGLPVSNVYARLRKYL